MFLMQLCLMEDGQKNIVDSLKYAVGWLAGCLVGWLQQLNVTRRSLG